MPGYLTDETEADRQMVAAFLTRVRRKTAGAGPADFGRIMARERHLETLNQPLPMSAQRFARLQSEVEDVQGEGAYLLVVDCGETGARAIRFIRRFENLDALQEAKRQVDAARCGHGCWRNHLLYRLAPAEGR